MLSGQIGPSYVHSLPTVSHAWFAAIAIVAGHGRSSGEVRGVQIASDPIGITPMRSLHVNVPSQMHSTCSFTASHVIGMLQICPR